MATVLTHTYSNCRNVEQLLWMRRGRKRSTSECLPPSKLRLWECNSCTKAVGQQIVHGNQLPVWQELFGGGLDALASVVERGVLVLSTDVSASPCFALTCTGPAVDCT